jgi:type V secretory pathway adhesin AidA
MIVLAVACGQAKKRQPAQADRAIITYVAKDQQTDQIPVVSSTPTPKVSPEPTPEPSPTPDQTDQIPVVTSQNPAQNASQNDCLPTDKIPCVSLF